MDAVLGLLSPTTNFSRFLRSLLEMACAPDTALCSGYQQPVKFAPSMHTRCLAYLTDNALARTYSGAAESTTRLTLVSSLSTPRKHRDWNSNRGNGPTEGNLPIPVESLSTTSTNYRIGPAPRRHLLREPIVCTRRRSLRTYPKSQQKNF